METTRTPMSGPHWHRHPLKLWVGLLINGAGAMVLLASLLGADA